MASLGCPATANLIHVFCYSWHTLYCSDIFSFTIPSPVPLNCWVLSPFQEFTHAVSSLRAPFSLQQAKFCDLPVPSLPLPHACDCTSPHWSLSLNFYAFLAYTNNFSLLFYALLWILIASFASVDFFLKKNFFIFKVYCIDYAITVVPVFFSPLSPSSLHCPLTFQHSPPPHSSCPWVVHISSLASRLFHLPFPP